MTPDAVAAGRAAFARGAWPEAYARFADADALGSLDPDDLDCFATAAYLVGHDIVCVQALTRAHERFLERGQPIRAARSAFWIAFTIFDTPGQQAQGAGWLARAQRLLDDVEEPCVERGWLLCGAGRQRVGAGELAAAHAAFTQAAEIGARFGDRDLLAIARQGQGRTLLAMNSVASGLALLDEVMIAVTRGEVAPIITGAVYCSVITACHDLFDLRRAQEWTNALQEWCVAHPDIVPFRGRCMIHRSELLQLHGAWHDALSEARRACERFTEGASQPEAGAAHYQLGEVYRLRGEHAKAEEAYRVAGVAGRKPQPGLALLRLGQGQLDAADAAIRLALQETRQPRSRVLTLAAAVEIMLARGDIVDARDASNQLARLAGQHDVPFLGAVSSGAAGAVALAEGQPLAALDSLHAASRVWQEIDAPYELAQTRTLIGLAYRALGDQEGALLELEAAGEVFEKLGAVPAAASVAALIAPSSAAVSNGLTGRELEVLRLIATGATNRTIAHRLSISEKTVARHVSNIFIKLDLSSRAAATAYAYEHKLV